MVLTVLIGGHIDWEVKGTVQAVSEILGVGVSTIYKYRKTSPVQFETPKRKKRSDALTEQKWWGHATTVMDNFWERHCDEVPDADNPAEKHDFSSKENHKFVEIDGNPEHSKRVCLGTQCPVLFVGKCLINVFICVQAMLVSSMQNGMPMDAMPSCTGCSAKRSLSGLN